MLNRKKYLKIISHKTKKAAKGIGEISCKSEGLEIMGSIFSLSAEEKLSSNQKMKIFDISTLMGIKGDTTLVKKLPNPQNHFFWIEVSSSIFQYQENFSKLNNKITEKMNLPEIKIQLTPSIKHKSPLVLSRRNSKLVSKRRLLSRRNLSIKPIMGESAFFLNRKRMKV